MEEIEKSRWVDNIYNEESKLNEGKRMLNVIRKENRWLDCMLRRESSRRDIFEGRVMAKATRGRKMIAADERHDERQELC